MLKINIKAVHLGFNAFFKLKANNFKITKKIFKHLK